ncbi:MAG TPA: protein kinase [Polyangiaceae bacterium]|nr:protein kinase [Polyangiaceae bacterium]
MAEDYIITDVGHLDPAARRVGTVLDGKWTLNRLLGVGGMAAVYEATHRNGARAAIKLFPFSVTTSAEFAERILREGQLANKIGHPAIVRVLDDHLDREREYAYLVMELLDGETARQRIERTGPMSPIEAVEFSIELADCLAAAHEKGVVHRDIKPENLFITTEGRLKVLDFGVARAVDGTSSSVTRTGAMLGTPAYMSPEQARGRPSELSARSDIYSAGATLLFLVAGEFVHEGESAQEVMVRAAWTPPKKMQERGLGIPPPICKVIDRCCEFEQKDRYPSALDMRADLEEARTVLSRDPKSAEPIRRTSKMPPPRGPVSTAPLPLRPTPQTSAEMTVADRTPPPAADSSRTHVAPNRRTALLVGGGVTVVVVALALALRPKTAPETAVPPLPPKPAAVEAPRPAPPPTTTITVAPAKQPEAVPEVTTRSATTRVGKRTQAAKAPAPRKPAPSLAVASVAPVATPKPTAPAAPAPSPRTNVVASPPTKPSGRDVGY